MDTGNGGLEGQVVPDAADRLFEISPAEFVKARDQLAKDLEAKGSTEEAQGIRALRKPTVGIWALNQAARRHPDKVERLLETFRRMQNPRSATDFREASSERHVAVKSLLDATAEILEQAGHPAGGSVIEKVTRTLLAAATDERAQRALAHGRLEKELEPTEFGFGLPPPPEDQVKARPDRVDRELMQARKRAEELRREADDLAATAHQLEVAAMEAELKLDLARQSAERARMRAERASRASAEKHQEADKALAQMSELENRLLG
jgi:hypothetical protein